MAKIKQPGVEVAQELITANVTTVTPSLNAVIVGPCYQIIKALNDNNIPQSDAFAGSYENGAGTIAYDLPNLKTGALVDEDSIQVYLTAGSSVRLKPPKDEEIVFSGTADSYVYTTGILTDSGEDFTAEGVLDTDVVRLTFRGEVIDFPITAVGTDTLTLTDQISESLGSSFSFQIIRGAAEFAYQSSAVNANYQFGDETNYITISAKGDYAGAAGDALSFDIDAGIVTSATSGFYSNGYLFVTSGSGLSALSSGDYIVVDTGGTPAAHEIQTVISDKALGLATTLGSAYSGVSWTAGEAVSTSSQTVSFSSGVATVSESYTGAVIAIVAGAAQTGDMSGTTLTLDDTSVNGSRAVTFIIKEEVTGSNNGSKGTGKGASASFATNYTTSNALLLESVTVSAVISSVSDAANKIYAATGLGDRQNLAFRVGTASQSFGVALASNGTDLEVTLATNANGAVTTTFTDLNDALTDSSDSNYVENVSDIYTSTETGSGGAFNAYGADHATYDLDGGADANNIILDADLLNGASGVANVHVSYKALRVDVSDQATSPALLSYSSITEMTAAIGPVSSDNPLALAAYYAMLNAPNAVIKAIGISATSDTQPQGTSAAYTSALEFLEAQDVYSMVPLTQDPEVLILFENHIDSMSSPSNKSERIGFFNKPFPAYSKATLLASGTAGSTSASFSSDYLFSTGVDFSNNSDFTTAVSNGDTIVLVVTTGGLSTSSSSPTLAAGVDGVKYGITVTDKNTDPFKLNLDTADVGNSTGWSNKADLTWAVYSIGSAISTAKESYLTVANYGSIYANRRIFLVWPPRVTSTVNGNDIEIDGYYLCAAWAGKVSYESIGQGFTNMTVSGFTGLKKSNEFFSKEQLDEIAGGGVYICVQDTDTSPLKCRHQLSTNVTTVQNRELSITKSVDYVAKVFRDQLIGKIGVFNLTNSFLDSLAALCQATLENLVTSGVIREGQLSSLAVDSESPDTVNITVQVSPYYPSNYILITLQV